MYKPWSEKLNELGVNPGDENRLTEEEQKFENAKTWIFFEITPNAHFYRT